MSILALKENIQKTLYISEDTINKVLTCLLADGHLLLEDLPGSGKTTLAKIIAQSMDAPMSRIQFTPDLLPSDIIGVNIYNKKEKEFQFMKGPVFSNVVLADELNRATPRTQSALLECMEEKQVTVDGTTYTLAAPFFVIATQNPIESAGTFPLPQAQLDRFTMQLSMGYPDEQTELALLRSRNQNYEFEAVQPVITLDSLKQAQEEANQIFVHDCILSYIAELAAATRTNPALASGVSPRASLTLMKCAKAYAYVLGESFVTPKHIQQLIVPVLAHRLLIVGGYHNYEKTVSILEQMMQDIKAPTEDWSKE